MPNVGKLNGISKYLINYPIRTNSQAIKIPQTAIQLFSPISSQPQFFNSFLDFFPICATDATNASFKPI